MTTESGHSFQQLTGAELEKQEQDFKGYTEGMVRLLPGRWLFPATFQQFADKYYKFEVKSDDVILLTYPKCGTTWLQEIVWTLRNNADLDNPKGAMPVNARVPFLEMDMLLTSKCIPPMDADHPLLKGFKMMCPGRDAKDGILLQITECSPSPRTIKSHLPFSLLPPNLLDNTKAVYMARNPKDAVLSFFHHSRIFKNHSYVGTFEDFVQYFVDDDLVYGPYWLHLKEAWEQRENKNLHIMFYEDLKENTVYELRKLSDFLGTKLNQDQLEKIAHYTSFPEMKARDSLIGGSAKDFFHIDIINKDGGFFRKGTIGDWKGKYTPQLEAKMDDWIKTNLADIGIKFKYGV